LNAAFPPLLDLAGLPTTVLAIAPHPDDEVLGCGGALALHARRGDRVHVLVLSDGGGQLEGDARREHAAARESESRAAAGRLGVAEIVFLGLRDGGLAAAPDLVARLAAELERDGSELVYAPSPFEAHPDHRAACLALAAALANGPRRTVQLFGVNRQVPANVLLDTTSVAHAKESALACFDSQRARTDLVGKSAAFDRAYTMDVDDASVTRAEGFVRLGSRDMPAHVRAAAASLVALPGPDAPDAVRRLPTATAVISTWNKAQDVCANLDALRAQTRPFDDIVVVDNASSDDTADRIRAEYPEVRLVVMPHSRYGACETFNIGFACARTELLAILDDDVVLPPNWLEGAMDRLLAEPETTAVVSTKIVEPGMPETYARSAAVNAERYMSTFRGCASLARTRAVREVGGYDERLFIYGNERDMTCRLLNRGYRVLQYPGVEAHHKTPFGIKLGKRSLYFHARNAWLGMLKYAPLGDLVRLPFLVVSRVLLRSSAREEAGEVSDATGTIGIGRSVRQTPGAWWVLFKAACSVLYNVPYCLRRREPVRSSDFELPLR
jgi:LmbE family N-acetylglucosaminyl deacetylase/GT2 family glycosyltransferase